MNHLKFWLFITLSLISNQSHAWITSNDTTIDSIALWQDNEIMYFHVSAGFWCYIPAEESIVKSLVMAAYSTKTLIQVHCHDKEENPMTFTPAHRLHRIIAK